MALKRIFLGLSVFLLTLSCFVGRPLSAGHMNTSDFVILETEVSASTGPMAPLYKSTRLYLSEVYEATQQFQLLGLNWQQALPEGTAANIEIHFRRMDGTWSEWQGINEDHDGPDHAELVPEKGYDEDVWSYLLTESSDAFQYRVHLSTSNSSLTPKLSNISFDYVDGGQPSVARQMVSKLIFNSDSEVVSRAEWGADEGLRLSKTYDLEDNDDFEMEDELTQEDPDMKIVERVNTDANGNSLLWPLEYPARVKKIIIHHTATTESIDDEEASIRSIYYYHAVTRRWGDIGYNYIVGPSGTVYEGRAGGDGVVAGHAEGYNTGSVGIALLGNYETSSVPAPMMKSLQGLVYEKAKLHGIDPDGTGKFRGQTMPNLLGHRDVGSTACPGDYTYDDLDGIREMVGLAYNSNRHSNTSKEYAYEETVERELLTLAPGGEATVTVKIKNTGSKTWDKSTFLTVNANSKADSIVSIPKDSKKRTAFMNESSVAPGKTASFTFKVSSKASGGLASFDMVPVFNGSKKVTHLMDLGFYVEVPTLSFDLARSDAPTSLKPGESKTVTVSLKNTGNFTWTKMGDGGVKLVRSGSSLLTSSSTLGALKETEVQPGGMGTFSFDIKAPTTAGSYTLYFMPKIEDSNAIISGSGRIALQVVGTTEDVLVSGTSGDLDFSPGETKSVWVQLKNTSGSTWSSTGSKSFTLSMTAPDGVTVGTPKVSFKTLSSGASTKVYFSVKAPSKTGSYPLVLRPRLGSSPLSKKGITLTLKVSGAESVTAVSYEHPIRVKLTPDNEVGTPIFTSDKTFTVYDGDTLLKIFSANSRVRVADSKGTFTVTSGSASWTAKTNVRVQAAEDAAISILTMEQRPAWNTSLNDNLFRGTVEVRDEGATPILINELELEDYLKGIAEVSNSDPTEKIKTIVTLARTYAVYYTQTKNGQKLHEKFPGKPYDLEDDPDSSQKYLGYGFEMRSPLVTEAVRGTVGKVVMYKGEVVMTPYFSRSDGKATKSAKTVWGWTTTPWLLSVPDTACTDTDGTFSGHGVGLSGCGASTLAEQGKSFVEIIKTYYTGVDVSTLSS